MKLGFMKLKTSVILIGLSNSGKTTIVHAMSKEPPEYVVPTVGFSIEKFMYQKVKLTTHDMSGQTKYQPLWDHYYEDAQGIIFVVDAADQQKLAEARSVLHGVLTKPTLKCRKIPMLVLCNKMDLPQALQPHDIASSLLLSDYTSWDFRVQGCSALKNQGIQEGMSWMCGRLRELL